MARQEAIGGAEDVLAHYIGVYEAETGEVQLVPARKMVVRTSLRPTVVQSNEIGDNISTVLTRLLLGVGMNADAILDHQCSNCTRRSLRYEEISEGSTCEIGKCYLFSRERIDKWQGHVGRWW
jgi:hypothetical protein